MTKYKVCKLLLFVFLCLSPVMILCQTAYAYTMVTDVTASASSYVAPYSPDRVVGTTPAPGTSAITSRWYAVNPGDRWIQLDLKQVHYIGRYYVGHLGSVGWDPLCNTRNFHLSSSIDGINWTVRDTVIYNTDSTTDRAVAPFAARYVRLYITWGNQTNFDWASITKFWVYATNPVGTLANKPSDKTYRKGETLDFTVNYPVSVIVNTAGGIPRIPITIGSDVVYAEYFSGSGTNNLVFRYTVKNGDFDYDGIEVGTSISNNGGTIRDALGNNAAEALNGIGGTPGILVDTTPIPGILQFDPTSLTINENAGSATLTVTRTDGTDGIVTADYTVTGGTATGGGIDYALEPGTVTFDEGETSKTIAVSIINDSVYEGDETIVVTLSNAAGGASLGSNAATITIEDDDPIPTYNINIDTLTGGEITASHTTATAGTAISLTITPDSGKRLKEGTLKYIDGTGDHIITGTGFAMPAAHVTVTAEFEVIMYTVTFNKNNGDTEASPVTMQAAAGSGTGTLPTPPARSGHTFSGWNTAPDGTGAAFTTATAVNADIMVYAQWTPVTSGGGGPSNTPAAPGTPTNNTGQVIVIINGEERPAGNESKSNEGGKTVVTVEVDNNAIEELIGEVEENNAEGEGNLIQVPIADTESEVARAGLTGDIIRKLEENSFDVSIKRDNVEYIIPAEEFNISGAAAYLGVPEEKLKDIRIEIRISKLDDEIVEKYSSVAEANDAELIFPPVKFEVVAIIVNTDGTIDEVEINRFSNYVERIMEIPEGVDPTKITTGIVFNDDGTYSHVPTEVFQKDGKWYARLRSLTNSDYSVIWYPVTVKSVEKHWARKAVNDLASRLIILDPEMFEPDKAITRAEFAEYIVRALGLYRAGSEYENRFSDVNSSDEKLPAILVADEYGIVTGYTDGTFRPEQDITREEAMTMYQRAMRLTKLIGKDTDRYKSYTDFDDVSDWAAASVKEVLAAGVFNGTSITTISPKSKLTCAEAAQAIRNLLVESKLIND